MHFVLVPHQAIRLKQIWWRDWNCQLYIANNLKKWDGLFSHLMAVRARCSQLCEITSRRRYSFPCMFSVSVSDYGPAIRFWLFRHDWRYSLEQIVLLQKTIATRGYLATADGSSNLGTSRFCKISIYDSIWLSNRTIDTTDILNGKIDISPYHMIYFD